MRYESEQSVQGEQGGTRWHSALPCRARWRVSEVERVGKEGGHLPSTVTAWRCCCLNGIEPMGGASCIGSSLPCLVSVCSSHGLVSSPERCRVLSSSRVVAWGVVVAWARSYRVFCARLGASSTPPLYLLHSFSLLHPSCCHRLRSVSGIKRTADGRDDDDLSDLSGG